MPAELRLLICGYPFDDDCFIAALAAHYSRNFLVYMVLAAKQLYALIGSKNLYSNWLKKCGHHVIQRHITTPKLSFTSTKKRKKNRLFLV
jgi:hypothetical protein